MKARLSDRTVRWVAWAVGTSSIALIVAAIVIMFLDRSTSLPSDAPAWSAAAALDASTNLGVPIIGILIASRRRDNLIGWLFLAAGLVLGFGGFAGVYAAHALVANPGSLPGGRALAWISNWTWPIPGGLLMFLFLLFPTGHLRSKRWLPVAWLVAVVMVLLTVGSFILATAGWSRPFAGESSVKGALVPVAHVIFFGAIFAFPVALLLAFSSVVVRFIGSKGEERLQLKWFVTAGALVAVTFGVGLFTNLALVQALQSIGFVLLWGAIATAILKHRLYDIDVIINKAVVYGGLAAFITAVYVLVVVVIGAVVGATQGLALIATAIVAVAFQPARARAHAIANRIVYGERATPYEVLSEFAERIGETYASDDILPRMARLLAEGTGASRATVWLRTDREIRPAASWPPDAGSPGSVRVAGDELPAIEGISAAVPVRHQGGLLGALTLAKAANDPLSPAEEKLVTDLAAQAGLVLRNFRLIEDLKASRQRLVAAQDLERRRLERNLHDGAQQQLVALAVKQRLAETLIDRDPEKARLMMSEIQTDTVEALENLRDLARGIYPPVLADQGLPAALEAQIRRAAIPVELQSDSLGRYPQEVEAAVYFCCLEALQNVAKYAGASKTTVRVIDLSGWLTFVVSDDGAGFDLANTPLGTGLRGMRDRLEALSGTLEIRSRPGGGTSLTGRIPTRVLLETGSAG